MFKRFKGLMALFAIICVTAIAGGSAYFYFGGTASDNKVIDNSPDNPNDTEVKADNILENYEFGVDRDLNETYTYYFFPSTLYMSDDFFGPNLNPESIFGYNEVILDDNGDPALDSKGQPQFNIVDGNGIKPKDTTQKYLTYYDYLANYLNNKSDSYLHSTPLSIGDDSYGISKTDGTHYFGNRLDGDDYSYNGYSLSLRDPYMLNNTDAYDFFLNNYNVNNFYGDASTSNESWGKLHQYDVLDTVETFKKSDEVLSPIATQSQNYSPLFDININTDNGLAIESDDNGSYTRSDLINVFSNLYQKGVSGETLNKNSLSQVEIHYNRSDRWPHSYDDFTNNFNTFSLISYGSGIGEDKGIGGNAFIQYNNKYPYVGTWVNSNDNMKHILTLYSGNLDEEGKIVSGTGYFAFYIDGNLIRNGYYDVNTFGYKYNIETNKIEIKGDDIEGSFVFEDGNQVSQMGNRAQYRNDRFGYWTSFYDWSDPNNEDYYIDNSASRYLPIKITVNGNLSPDDMAKVIPSLSTSMFDDHMWFDFSSNVWTYVTYANNAYNFDSKEYTTATEGFTAQDITNIFDIMQNPSKYADKDGNIRLFPVFSNGKNGNAVSVSDGGGDAVQASFSYANDSSNIENDILPSSTKLTWSTYSYRSASNGFYDNYDVSYAVLKNVEIKKGKFKSITFKIDTTYFDYEPHWGGFWIDVYKLEASTIDEFATTYGEGLYTFYFFLGNRGNNKSLSNETAFPNVKNKSLIENVVSYNDSSNELAHKYLINIEEPKWAQTDKGQGDQGNGSSVNTPNYSRPVALAVEKVTNLRLVSDIPIAEGENGLPSADQDWDSIDGNIKQGLLNAKNFTIADEVYGFKDNIYDEDNIDLSSGTRLDTNNPYIYFIQNADFRFVNNLYFQIRFSNDYINDAMNVTTDYSSIKEEKPDKYVAYSINNQVLKFKFQDSDDGDVFIENATAGSGTDVRQGFKLKDYNARGIYDILLISHGTAGNKQQYYMYVNRHTNSFIKLFYGNPGTFEFDQTGSGDTTSMNNFVSHKLPGEDDNANELYTYTVDGNTITAVDEYKSCRLTIIYDEATKSLKVTYLNEGHTYYGDFVPADSGEETPEEPTAGYIGTWTGKVGLNEIELVINDDGTILYNDVSQTRDSSSTLLWNGQTYLGEYLTTSSTGTRYYQSESGEERPIQDPNSDNSLYAAIREKCGLTPGNDNIYKIIDAVTGRVVAYYNSGIGRVFTSEGSAGSGNSDDAINLFAIMKNYVLYIDPSPLNSVTS